MKLLLLISWAICLTPSLVAQSESNGANWVAVTSFPGGGIDDGSSFAIGDKLYMGCGLNEGFQLRNDWHVFNTQNETWETMDTLPASPRQYASSFSNNRFGYLVGGVAKNEGFTNACFRYDSKQKEWTALSTPPWSARSSCAVFETNEAAYLVGGRDDSTRFNDVWKFEFATEEWSYETQLPSEGMDELAAFSSGQYGFITLGRSDTGYNSRLFVYHLPTKTWSEGARFPGRARSYAGAASTSRGGIIAAGQDRDDQLLSACFRYNALEDRWDTLVSLSRERPMRGFSLIQHGNTYYTFGGLAENYTRIRDVFRLRFIESASGHFPLTVRLYPNPGSDRVNIAVHRSFATRLKLEVYNQFGVLTLLDYLETDESAYTIDSSEWESGIYHLQIRDAESIYLYKSSIVIVKS